RPAIRRAPSAPSSASTGSPTKRPAETHLPGIARTTGIVRRLTGWAEREQIGPAAFNCPNYDACNEATGRTLNRGESVLMSCVGRNYATPVRNFDRPLRLVILGLNPPQLPDGLLRDSAQPLTSTL